MEKTEKTEKTEEKKNPKTRKKNGEKNQTKQNKTRGSSHQLAVPGELPGVARLRHLLVSSVHQASQIVSVTSASITSATAAPATVVSRGGKRPGRDHRPHHLQLVRLQGRPVGR